MKILICGLPGSGKTTLAKCLSAKLNADWFNADEVRATYDDWDFSESGRIRQAKRMSTLADKSQADHTLCDFVAPTQATREAFNADFDGDQMAIYLPLYNSSQIELQYLMKSSINLISIFSKAE